MKKKGAHKILMLLILALFFTCKNREVKTISEIEIELSDLTLNNGKKWIANDKTHIGIQRIDSILKSYESKPDIDGKGLAKKLSKETSFIIKNCDMKGTAHDQLHIVLVPILEKISEIKEVKNTSEIEKKTRRLKRLVAKYFEYFKT